MPNPLLERDLHPSTLDVMTGDVVLGVIESGLP